MRVLIRLSAQNERSLLQFVHEIDKYISVYVGKCIMDIHISNNSWDLDKT